MKDSIETCRNWIHKKMFRTFKYGQSYSRQYIFGGSYEKA